MIFAVFWGGRILSIAGRLEMMEKLASKNQ